MRYCDTSYIQTFHEIRNSPVTGQLLAARPVDRDNVPKKLSSHVARTSEMLDLQTVPGQELAPASGQDDFLNLETVGLIGQRNLGGLTLITQRSATLHATDRDGCLLFFLFC